MESEIERENEVKLKGTKLGSYGWVRGKMKRRWGQSCLKSEGDGRTAMSHQSQTHKRALPSQKSRIH